MMRKISLAPILRSLSLSFHAHTHTLFHTCTHARTRTHSHALFHMHTHALVFSSYLSLGLCQKSFATFFADPHLWRLSPNSRANPPNAPRLVKDQERIMRCSSGSAVEPTPENEEAIGLNLAGFSLSYNIFRVRPQLCPSKTCSTTVMIKGTIKLICHHEWN